MRQIEKSEKRGGAARRVFLFLPPGILALIAAAFLWMTATPGNSYSGPPAQPSDAALAGRLEAHVRAIATKPRNLDRASSLSTTLAYLERELASYGYIPQRQNVLDTADNLIVRVAARRADALVLIIGAHYDTAHLSPGADDNASGVAALLELARQLKNSDGQRDTAIELVFFANEEPPYFKTPTMGSYVHAQSIAAPDRITGMISLETMGYFSTQPDSQHYPFPLSLRYPSTGDFIAFVGDTSARSFLREMIGKFRDSARIPSVGGTAPASVQGIDWSDHWAYSGRGIPAFMITDTAIFRNPHYHQRTDTPDTLDYDRLALVVEGIDALLTEQGRAP